MGTKIKALFQLSGQYFKLVGLWIKLLFNQLNENRRSFKQAKKELYLRNETIRLWAKKPNSGTNKKRLVLFNYIMNEAETENFNLINLMSDKEIERCYNSSFFNKGYDEKIIKKKRIYSKNFAQWPFTVSKLDIYCMNDDVVYCTIKVHNNEYNYGLNGRATDVLGLINITDSEYIIKDDNKMNESINEFIEFGLNL